MEAIEEKLIEIEVRKVIMPEIKALIPGIIGFLLRALFPKMEAKLIDKIKELFELLLLNRGVK